MPNCVAGPRRPRADRADDERRARPHDDRPPRLGGVAPPLDGAAPGRRSGSARRRAARAAPVSRAPSTNVPWLEPASSIRAPPPLPPRSARAGARRSGPRAAASRPGRGRSSVARRAGRRCRRPARARAARRRGQRRPAAPQNAAPRVTCRRQSGHSTAGPTPRERLEDRVVAAELERCWLLRVVDRQPHELAGGRTDAVIGLHDDELEPVGPPDRPCTRARRAPWRPRAGSRCAW